MGSNDILAGLRQSVLDGDEDGAASYTEQAIDGGLAVMEIVKGARAHHSGCPQTWLVVD